MNSIEEIKKSLQEYVDKGGRDGPEYREKKFLLSVIDECKKVLQYSKTQWQAIHPEGNKHLAIWQTINKTLQKLWPDSGDV